jgi:hypothetical protein
MIVAPSSAAAPRLTWTLSRPCLVQ